MVFRPAIFFIIQAGTCLYAARRGGIPERLTAAAMAIAAIATAALPTNPLTSFRAPEWGEFSIDLGLLAGLTLLACRANRFWPMWLAAMQLDAIGVHAVKVYDPSFLPNVYSAAVSWVAYPMIATLLAGTYRHRQRSLVKVDRAWSPSRW